MFGYYIISFQLKIYIFITSLWFLFWIMITLSTKRCKKTSKISPMTMKFHLFSLFSPLFNCSHLLIFSVSHRRIPLTIGLLVFVLFLACLIMIKAFLLCWKFGPFKSNSFHTVRFCGIRFFRSEAFSDNMCEKLVGGMRFFWFTGSWISFKFSGHSLMVSLLKIGLGFIRES